MRVKPPLLLSHPQQSALRLPVKINVPLIHVKARSYQFLVTRHGVSPARAQQRLGLTKAPS